MVQHYTGPLVEENVYYPFGLVQQGISSKAFGRLENNKKYNGIELEKALDLNVYDAQFREIDPQIGRWWEIDPKTDEMYMWSTYASNFDNPVRFADPLGDMPDCCPPPSAGLNKGLASLGIAPNKFTDYIGGWMDLGDKMMNPITTVNGLVGAVQAQNASATRIVNGNGTAGDFFRMVDPGNVAGQVQNTVTRVNAVANGDMNAAAQLMGDGFLLAMPGVGGGGSTAATKPVTSTKGTTGFRYMSKAELKAIKESDGAGFLRGGRAGETYFTKDLYKSAAKAAQRLGLVSTPELRVEFKIQNNPTILKNGTKVLPLNGLSGGGAEFMTLDPVKIRLINSQPLR